ncbi:hypothetical protein [Lachnobacterium bovis]|uniref:hypothetical protein n=1 Tax=Lachnobacterium bovis TaxID=140626 RepID=UPI000405C6DF|nr:hypothetical protein [Lachnobacterium bovis]
MEKKYKGSCYLQRVSSNRFSAVKAQFSQRKFDFYTYIKNHFYNVYGEHGYKWHFEKKINTDDFLPRDYFIRMDSLKIQYYNIDKKK